MFGISKLWLIAGAFALLFAASVWHETMVMNMKAEIIAAERGRVAAESAKLQRDEAIRAADNAAQSEREAGEHEATMMHMTRVIEAANLNIEELEKGSKCTVSRETVRKLNGLR